MTTHGSVSRPRWCDWANGDARCVTSNQPLPQGPSLETEVRNTGLICPGSVPRGGSDGKWADQHG